MKIKAIIRKTIKILGYTLLAIVLLVSGSLVALYSPWFQNLLREKLVERVNSVDGMSMSLESFRLRFPLRLELGGLSLVSENDTLVAAQRLETSVALLPLLKGEAEANKITLADGRFTLGSPDSAMYMTLSAEEIALQPVAVGLKDMSIDIPDGLISGAVVDMTIKPDTAVTAAPATEPTSMSIRLGQLRLDDFTYRMSLMPTIDSLGVNIADGLLTDGYIDLKSQRIDLAMFSGSRLDAAYIAPDSAQIAATPIVATSDTATTAPWTIAIDSISFTDSKALYTTRGLQPQPGLDFAYIQVDSLDLQVKEFFNQATTLRLPVKLHGKERCGVTLDADGIFALDSAAMYLDSLHVTTATTVLKVNAMMGLGDLTADPSLPLQLKAKGGVGVADLRKMFPAFMPYLVTLPANNQIDIDANLHGSMARLDIETLDVALTRCLSISASGYGTNLTDPKAMTADIILDGKVMNANSIKNSLLKDAKDINIPPMRLDGHVRMVGPTVSGKIGVRTGGGSLALNGNWNSNAENYKTSLDVVNFPIETFMPNLGAGKVTASLKANGHGYDPFSKKMKLDAAIDVKSAEYQDYTYRDILLNATVADGNAHVDISSANPETKVQLMAEGNLAGDTYDWTVIADGDDIDLMALKLMDIESNLSFNLSGRAVVSPKTNDYNAELTLNDLDLDRPTGDITLSNVKAILNSSDSLTTLSLRNRDLSALFESKTSLDSLMNRFSSFSDTLTAQINRRFINVDALHNALPGFKFDVVAGSDNAITDILAPQKTTFRNLILNADNDSTLSLDSRLLGLKTGSTRIDTVSLDMSQRGEDMDILAHVGNRPGTFDDFAQVNLNGRISGNEVGLRLRQQNIKGKQGFDVGIAANIVDSVATLRFTPLDQVIGYQPWTVNDGNFISYVLTTKHIDANLKMTGGNSNVEILTDHVPGSTTQEDLVISLNDIHLADWIAINPFAPPIKGDLNADVRLRENDGALNGQGNVAIDNFYYGKDRVATVNVDFDVTTRPGGMLYAKSNVYVDGQKTMTLAGNLNDTTSTSPYNLDFSMIHFPLATVNPFLPPRIAKLRGTLNGDMRISGESNAPIFNGELDFDSTAVKLFMTGTDYEFSDVKIPVKDNLVTFDKFTINGVNNNPLLVDGTVDISSLASPLIDLTLKADNMQLVNTVRAAKGADVYGKAFISLDSRVHGNMSLLFVNADLKIVAPTNVTYIIPDATDNIVSRSDNDMVRFVNFTDTTAVLEADTIADSSMAMILDASLTIENGTTIGVDLSTDGKNRVQLEADGMLNYTMSPVSDGRMTGRLNLNEGYVRYSPPLMSEKNFAFQNGSFVAFNGDMMNPTLNVHAVDVIKANVTQSGQNSRLVNFDVALNITGTLNRIDVGFDLSTDDDVTVANELQSMSPDQRANQAMNMLLYGIYAGPGTKGDASISGNALYSFLESQLNSWAANNIKGVDLSFGIDQYNRTVDGSSSQTTSYSYQVSKSLFNDRFKIVVGGNYSTDANADENFSQNLINDISFEYFLNRKHTMYVRIFRHTGYESILEGEITQTGVGFVYRKKLNNLSDMFKFLKPRRRENK